MRTWPALDVDLRGLTSAPPGADAPQTSDAATFPDSGPVLDIGARFGRPDLFQAALVDFDVAAVDEQDAERWRVFFHDAVERDRAASALRRDFPELTITAADVADEDWAARSQASLRAIQVDDL